LGKGQSEKRSWEVGKLGGGGGKVEGGIRKPEVRSGKWEFGVETAEGGIRKARWEMRKDRTIGVIHLPLEKGRINLFGTG
jgi:hypothetical protein